MKALALRGLVVSSFVLFGVACSIVEGPDNGGAGGPGSGQDGDGGAGACAPQCDGKTCGDDGCGGSCGTCGTYQLCDDATSACKAACDVTPLDTSKTIDVDLEVAAVTGNVTWNGGAPPSGLTNATIYFVDKSSGARVSTTFGASYSITLYAGTYAIGVDTLGGAATGVPNEAAIVKDDVTVAAGAKIDLAIATATIKGAVTVDGQDVPQGSSRGSVLARRSDGSTASASVAATGTATFSIPVYAGTYDLAFDSENVGTALPSQYAYVTKGVAVSADVTQNLAMKTATVSGTITQNGGALPTDAQSRGEVVFSSADASAVGAAVATTGAGTYTTKIYTGTYDVAFDSESSTTLPRQTAPLAKATAIAASATQGYDLKVIDVTGTVTKNGAALATDATATGGRAAIELVGTQGLSNASAEVPPTGAASFAIHAYAGTYDVVVDSTAAQKVLPLERATIKRGVSLTSTTALPVDLPTATLHGTITVDGAALADEKQERGSLVFVERTTGSRFAVSAGTTGAATYSVELYEGIYGVELDASTASTSLPHQSTHVLDTNVTADATLDVPLKTLTASGAVTLNHAQFPDAPSGTTSRGSIELLEKLTGTRVSYDIGASGAAHYSVRVFDGGYDFHFSASSTEKAVPDVDQRVLLGCVPVDTSCSQSDKDLSGSWLLDFTGWGTMELTLAQSGKGLTGYADSTWGDGPLASGTRGSSSVSFVATSGVDITVTGDVANGCVMTGHAVASTGYTTDWVGQRLE